VVICGEKGTAFDSSHFRSRVFNRVLDKAGLRKVRVHDLRHSYGALLIQAGESLAYIRDQLGHHSIKVTVDISVTWLQRGTRTPWTVSMTTVAQPSTTYPQPPKKKGLTLKANPFMFSGGVEGT
jgi:hypothetical protein